MRGDRAWDIFQKNKSRTASSEHKRRDWVTTSLALLSAVVSVGTVYYNFVRQSDDVRVSLPEFSPFISRGAEWWNLSLESDMTVTFVNSGNRTAAITDTSLRLAYRANRNELTNECQHGRFVSFNIEPLVIKPGEIVPKTLRTIYTDVATDPVGVYPPFDDHVLCWSVSIITPGRAVEEILVPLAVHHDNGKPNERLEQIPSYDFKSLVPLMVRNATFDWWR